MFTDKDLQQIADHGLTPEAVELQIENFRRGFPYLGIVRAASPGDGVVLVSDEEAEKAIARYEASKEFDHWILFNGGGNKGLLCVEPQLGAVNGLNKPDGHRVMKPGEVLTLWTKITCEE